MNSVYTDTFINKILKKSLVAALALLAVYTAKAQNYYPGGMGKNNLKLWLSAADASTLLKANGSQAGNGDAIAQWSDKSGNGNHAIQASILAQPVSLTNQLNGNAGVVFSAIIPTQYMTGPSGTFQTMVAVRIFKGTLSTAIGNLTTVAHYRTLFATGANQDFSIRGGGISTNYGDASPFNVNDWAYQTTGPSHWLNGSQTVTSNTGNQILVSAALNPVSSTYSISTTFQGGNTGGFARGMYGGDAVYELLGYSNTLNTTQRIILENYEAALWGLTGVLPSSGYTGFTPPSVSAFNKNLVGIGYTSSSDNFLANPVTTPNSSTDGLGFSSGTGAADFLNAAGFVMAAHNGQANTIITNANIAGIGGNTNIWNRSWYLQKNNGNATGKLTFNFSQFDYNGTAPNATYSYGILYNATDGSFASGTNKVVLTSSTVVGTNMVSFVANATNTANGYYTLIWSQTSVLPVVISGFEVTKNNGSSVIQWTTSQDINSDHFEIQRSEDNSGFTSIANVKAKGAATAPNNYNVTDHKPLPGWNYYRLKMVDADGSFLYSETKAIEFNNDADVDLKIYPNPVTDVLEIRSSTIKGKVTVEIINTAGQVVQSAALEGNNLLLIPVTDLSKGVYFLKISNTSFSTVRKMVKD